MIRRAAARRERGQRERDPHARYDSLEDEDDGGDDEHLLDVTA